MLGPFSLNIMFDIAPRSSTYRGLVGGMVRMHMHISTPDKMKRIVDKVEHALDPHPLSPA